jgi:hypothetical protein
MQMGGSMLLNHVYVAITLLKFIFGLSRLCEVLIAVMLSKVQLSKHLLTAAIGQTVETSFTNDSLSFILCLACSQVVEELG